MAAVIRPAIREEVQLEERTEMKPTEVMDDGTRRLADGHESDTGSFVLTTREEVLGGRPDHLSPAPTHNT